MRRLVPLVVVVLLAVGCGDDGGTTEGTAEITSIPTTVPAATTALPASSAVATTTSAPVGSTSDTIEEGGELLNAQWSTLEIWGGGWVEIEAVAVATGMVERDSEVGRLFPDEVFDAIEAAGATELVGAYQAVVDAGLFSEVAELIRENPGALDALFDGVTGTLGLRTRTTLDGAEWAERPMPFVSGRLVGSNSDGDHLALVFVDRQAESEPTVAQLATTTDLEEWAITDLELSPTTRDGDMEPHRTGDGWYVVRGGESAWLVADSGEVGRVALPSDDASWSVRATDAGLIAWTWSGEPRSRLAVSTDGIDWQTRALPIDARIESLVPVDGGVVIQLFVSAEDRPSFVGPADASEWTEVVLPPEVDFAITLTSRHHRAFAERVAQPGRGRGAAERPSVPYIASIERDGHSIDVEVSGFDLFVSVTDVATGDVVVDRVQAMVGLADSDDEYVLLAGDGTELALLPREEFDLAASAARSAALDALPPEEAAIFEERYVLVTLDGRIWESVLLDDAPIPGDAQVISVNRNRVLFGLGDEYWIHETQVS